MEWTVSPHPHPQGSQAAGAGRDAGEVCSGTSAEQMCRLTLQQFISIDLFWRRFFGLRAGGPGSGLGGCSQDGGAAWRRQAGLLGMGLALHVRPWTVGSSSASADGMKEATLR